MRHYDYTHYYPSLREEIIPAEPRRDTNAAKIIRAAMAAEAISWLDFY